MATLTVQQLTSSGTGVTLTAAAAGGDAFANDGKTIFEVNNGGGSSMTVTLTSQNTCNQGGTHNGGGSVPAGAVRRYGPLDRGRFNDATGLVQVTYSAVTSVTVGAYKI